MTTARSDAGSDPIADIKAARDMILRQHYTGRVLSQPIGPNTAAAIAKSPRLLAIYHAFDYLESCCCDNPRSHRA